MVVIVGGLFAYILVPVMPVSTISSMRGIVGVSKSHSD